MVLCIIISIMKILQNGNKSAGQSVEEQIALAVHGFVQVWNKFEDTITREMADDPGLKQTALKTGFAEDGNLLFRVGTALNGSSGLTMGELSDALAVPLSTATRVIDTLVERGYVERFSDSEDRRVVRVRFTRQGLRLYKFIDGRIAEHVRRLSSNLTGDEMLTLVRLLAKVSSAVRQTLR